MGILVDQKAPRRGRPTRRLALLTCCSFLFTATLRAADAPQSPPPTATNTEAPPETASPATTPPTLSTNTPLTDTNLPPSTNRAADAVAPPQRAAPATNSLPGFRLPASLRIELVAAEPDICSPVAMAFDENGRLFVAEMRDFHRQPDSAPGRIRVLENAAGDGVFSSSAVYADGIGRPSALACYDGGVFVASAPDILYLKDTADKGAADQRAIVLSGLGDTNSVLGLVGALLWGLDNRIHGARPGLLVQGLPVPDVPFPPARNFSFDPRSLKLAVEPGNAGTGMAFDRAGHAYLTDTTRVLRQAMYHPRYTARNPWFAPPAEMVDVANPATAALAPTPGTDGAVNGRTPALPRSAATNRVAPAWLTAARGTMLYASSILPSNFWGSVFVADPDAHLVHRLVLRQSGLETVALRAPDDAASEFLSSSDPHFRPMHLVEGPEGAIYVADFRQGGDSGRIYRIVPVTFNRPVPVRLGRAKTFDLVAALAHPDRWRRDSAARLLFQQRDTATAGPLLVNMLSNSRVPFARLHALHALDGLGLLSEPHVLRALRDPDERVREHGIRLAERLVQDHNVSEMLWTQLRSLTSDASLPVRYQLAFTLGEIQRPERPAALAALFTRDSTNLWLRTAVLSSLNDGAADFVRSLDARAAADPRNAGFFRTIAAMVGTRGKQEDVSAFLELIDTLPPDSRAGGLLLTGLGEGLHRTRSSLNLVDPQRRLQRLYSAALRTAINTGAPETARLDSLALLDALPYSWADNSDVLLLSLTSGQSPVFQTALAGMLGRSDAQQAFTALLVRWPALSPPARAEAAAGLLTRIDQLGPVLAAVERGNIGANDLAPMQINFLRTHRDPRIGQTAIRLFGPYNPQRPQVMTNAAPALRLLGGPARGRQLFLARCAACHRLGGEGQAVGPDLAPLKIYGKERLLTAILQPGLQIHPGFVTQALETRGGEIVVGIIENQDNTVITVRQPRGVRQVWPRANIQTTTAQSWSLMPDGLEQGLSNQDLADLLEYLSTAPR